MGASDEAIMTEEAPPSFGEAMRICHRIETLRRIWWGLPFFAAVARRASRSLASLFYEEVFDLDERARGFVAAAVEPAQLIGLIVGGRIGTKLVARDPGLILRFVGVLSFIAAGLLAGFALSPWLWMSVVVQRRRHRGVRRHRARASSPPSPWRSRRGPGRWASASRRCGSCPACSSSRSSAGSGTAGALPHRDAA